MILCQESKDVVRQGICTVCQQPVDLRLDIVGGVSVWVVDAHAFLGEFCEGSDLVPQAVIS